MKSKTERFRALRAEHNLRLEDIAQLMGRSYSTVAQWSSGRSKQIPAITLELLEVKLQTRSQVNA